ncbi:protein TRIGALACTOSYLDIACYLGLYCEROL 4, chloroplastic isoform X1 [Vigna radiata var. radiata]|uniref:Protein TRIGALACTOSYLDIACYLGLYCEROL 4, chloroplastic isoform X1 n=1 Tax=Vigna radiata var. radiata TaxID=3916 RepID=A0A1S3TYQ8_VIGRR|nr:protein TRIGALACTOSYLDIACYLGLYCEROL 4, chloroplastic isoform X1 [Vigna radiata var. radiata]
MKKLRWVMDGGGFWDLDISTSQTIDGLARAVPGDPLPLGLSRGIRLSRPRQLEFMHRFMNAPLIPSYSKPHGLSLHRLISLPFSDDWVLFLLGQFNLQRFVSSVKSSEEKPKGVSSWLKTFGRHLQQKSLYALGFSSEFQLGENDMLFFGLDAYDDNEKPRGKFVFHHKFPEHDLTVEAVSPGLFVDNNTGNYWDVPFSTAVDLASVTTSDSSIAYHLSAHYTSGSPKQFQNIHNHNDRVPPSLLPGLAFKSAVSYRKKVGIWRSEAPKLKLVQPYDVFLSNPHVSASGIIGAASTAAFGDNSARAQIEDGSPGYFLQVSGVKSSFLADMFASVSFTAQHGNFQKPFLDLTRFQARLDFPSGFKFLSAATGLTQDLLNSQKPSLEAVQAILPNATLSLQQQIVGPVSFRVDSGIKVDLKNPDWPIHALEPVFALEYALQVLGSAKAVAWYCPKRQEFMAELRFLET